MRAAMLTAAATLFLFFAGLFCHRSPCNLAADGLQSDCRQQSVPSPAVAILSSAALFQSTQYALL